METENVVRILPVEEWKAARTIEFRLLNVPCLLQYYRKADITKLKEPVTDPNTPYMQMGELELPQDELDRAMLEWVRTFDPAPIYRTRLLMTNTSEADARRIVEGMQEVNAEFLSNPDFSGLTRQELLCLNGREFTQFCLYVPIRTMWALPYPNYNPTAIRWHSWRDQGKEARLIDQIRREIWY
ncbi:MAG: hypothetical protein K2G67_03565 [Muribaculaceae bacterium]|nr:hypothetical protein [Muribaculaceae bacterium]